MLIKLHNKGFKMPLSLFGYKKDADTKSEVNVKYKFYTLKIVIERFYLYTQSLQIMLLFQDNKRDKYTGLLQQIQIYLAYINKLNGWRIGFLGIECTFQGND